jgi:glycerophosphoryl diester phosphodiesterase
MNPWLIALIVIVSVLAICTIVYLVLSAPSLSRKRKAALAPYLGTKFAHRGLHDGTRAENSMSAFRAAVEAGYGIELDVRLSHDGELVVFHDETLDRVCGTSGRVDEKDYFELRLLRLCGTEDGIPLLRDVLSEVGGRVPLLIELKQGPGELPVAKKLMHALEGYKGPYVIESFNPMALVEIKELKPEVLRGQLCDYYFKNPKLRKPLFFVLQLFLTNFKVKPDFISYNHKEYRNAAFKLQRFFFRAPTFAWTVESEEEERASRAHGFDTVIFEGYMSEK